MFPAEINPDAIAVSIPVIMILGGVAIGIVAIITAGRKKELRHKERLIAMEKGIELPPDDVKIRRPAYARSRVSGLVLLFFGLALTIALWVEDGAQDGVWGLLPLGIGLGFLVSAHIEKREVEERERRDRETRLSG